MYYETKDSAVLVLLPSDKAWVFCYAVYDFSILKLDEMFNETNRVVVTQLSYIRSSQ